VRKILLSIFILSLEISAGNFRITGTVVSDNQKMIGARYMGYVKRIYFDIGDKVKREDTLFELESAEFDILKNQADLALEQAEIMVDMYRTRMDSIKRNKARLKRNGSSNFTSMNPMSITATQRQHLQSTESTMCIF
jgi:multidrug efflux pump subunit AcrA (membrane-fusion protein)